MSAWKADALPLGDARIPKVFQGSGEIKLVILGQDPTVKNIKSRSMINTVLSLDRNGALRRYLGVCPQRKWDKNSLNVMETSLTKN